MIVNISEKEKTISVLGENEDMYTTYKDVLLDDVVTWRQLIEFVSHLSEVKVFHKN
jgi:hypothetical protein